MRTFLTNPSFFLRQNGIDALQFLQPLWTTSARRNLVSYPGNTGENLAFISLKRYIPNLIKQIDRSNLEFNIAKDSSVVVYTDGSCLNNNMKSVDTVRKSGIGVFWGIDDHPLNLSLPHGGTKLTNNRSEIAAAHAAIMLAKAFGIERLTLYTDSKNLVKACKYWLPYWQMNGWRLKSCDKPVTNRDMWKKLTEDLLHVLVNFQYADDKISGIIKAHKLAQKGANAQQG